MLYTYTLYIGSNNDTHKLETAKIRKILDAHIDAYTFLFAEGVWKGTSEHSAVVELLTTHSEAHALMAELKTELHQEAIGYRVSQAILFA